MKKIIFCNENEYKKGRKQWMEHHYIKKMLQNNNCDKSHKKLKVLGLYRAVAKAVAKQKSVKMSHFENHF